MEMQPKKKERLMAYTAAAKAIVYEPSRAEKLVAMAASPQGAQQAVDTVFAALEQRKPIPPAIAPLLAVNIYMILVDLAQQVVGQPPDSKMLLDTIKTLLAEYTKRYATKGRPQESAQPQGQGLLAQGVM